MRNPSLDSSLVFSRTSEAFLTYWILTNSGKVIARSTVQHVTREDLLDPQKKTRFE